MNHRPDRNRPGYSESGKWIGHAEWGKLMHSPDGGIGGFIILLVIIGVLYLIGRQGSQKFRTFSKLKDIERQKELDNIYKSSDFFFPELDTIVFFRTNEGENPILNKYSKYGAEWRTEFFKDHETLNEQKVNDLIDGTYKYFEQNGNLTVEELKSNRYNSVQSLEKYSKIKLGLLQETKRVLEDNESYPWNGKSEYLLYNEENLKRKKNTDEKFLDLAIYLTTLNKYSIGLIIGLMINFLGRFIKIVPKRKIARKTGTFVLLGSLTLIILKVFF